MLPSELAQDGLEAHFFQQLKGPIALFSHGKLPLNAAACTDSCVLARIINAIILHPAPEEQKDLMAYVIAEPCIGTKDTACVDSCPVDCIHPKKDSDKFGTEEMLYIDPVECIDCGACVPVCPVSAIFALDDLPEKWKEYTERNAKYFGR